MANPRIPYPYDDNKPPKSPTVVHGTKQANVFLPSEDTARYIVDPDDFARPYLAVPGGRAFVWPLGTEGFEVQEQAELGRHKYIGEIQMDIDVIHKAETIINLSGLFPGWTSVANMNALRQIFYADTPGKGKVLHLPGILPNLQYVVCESLTHSHAEQEMSQDIAYQLSVVKVGTGATSTDYGKLSPGQPGTKGTATSGTRIFNVTQTYRTLRGVSLKVFGTMDKWPELEANPKNKKLFNNIPSSKIPTYQLPLGAKVYY